MGTLGASVAVVYDGHNEFMDVPSRFSPALLGSALYRRFMVFAPRVTVAPGRTGSAAYGGPEQRAAVVARFASNLDELVATLQRSRVSVVLVTQASEIVRFDPAWSVTDDPRLLEGLDTLPADDLATRWHAHPDVADVAFAAGGGAAPRGRGADGASSHHRGCPCDFSRPVGGGACRGRAADGCLLAAAGGRPAP